MYKGTLLIYYVILDLIYVLLLPWATFAPIPFRLTRYTFAILNSSKTTRSTSVISAKRSKIAFSLQLTLKYTIAVHLVVSFHTPVKERVYIMTTPAAIGRAIGAQRFSFKMVSLLLHLPQTWRGYFVSVDHSFYIL